MIELRWLKRKTGEQVLNKYGFFTDGEVTVLQYRQKVDITTYAGLGPFPDAMKNIQWSDWKDVPAVDEIATNYQTNKCPKCGLELKGAMSYTCTTLNCPTGLGSST
jgi:hypothetical protein